MYTASSDGKVCFTDLESGTSSTVLDLNPDGWAVSFFKLNISPSHGILVDVHFLLSLCCALDQG